MDEDAFADRNTTRAWAIDLGVCVVVGLVLGVLGPFGSYLNDGVLVRLSYWVGVVVFSGVVHAVVIRRLRPVAARAGVPLWVWLSAVVLALNVPLSALSRAAAIAIWPVLREAVGPLEWFAQSLLVALIFSAAFVFLRFRSAPGRVAAAPSGDLEPDAFRPQEDLLCLQMEDHYVRIHTAGGSRLVLMSMSQAIGQAGGVEGLRTHRSWWVARRAVEGVIEDGRNLRLRLAGGIEAPVARASVARLREAGWLA